MNNNLFREIIVDNFAGGGGTSTGFFNATGRHVDIAINHDPAAIAMHEANHPQTDHYCESVYEVDPREAVKGQAVGLCWLSPDCTHFSKARSGKPASKKIRGLAWVGLKWAALVKPRVMMLENVEEFKTWGPVGDNGFPCPINKGQTFEGYKLALSTGLGRNHPAWKDVYSSLFEFNYDIQEKLTIYKAIKNGCGYEVEFKELRACDYGTPTIRKRLFMIARRDGQQIVWPKATHGDPKSPAVKKGKLQPYKAAADCIDWTIQCPSIFERKKPLVENTMKRIFKGLKKFVIENEDPFFISTYYGPKKDGSGFDRGSAINDPIGTITAGGYRHALVTPFMTKFNTGATGYEVTEPTHTITAGGKQKRPGTAITQGVVVPYIVRQFGNSVGHKITEPNGTIVSGGNGKSNLLACNLVKHFGGGYTGHGNCIKAPLSTVTTTDHNALVSSHLIKMRNGNTGSPMNEPMHTITSGGLHMGEVRAFLIKYYGSEKDGCSLKEPLHTVVSKDRFGLVTVQGQDHIIADIGMRMLQPRELYRAQGFPENYIIDPVVNGKKLSKTQQVQKCGNSVPPQFSEALIRANMPELCTQPLDKSA